MGRPSKYPAEFREQAVELLKANPAKTVAEVARDAGAFVAGPTEQGAWLERLGIQARARMLANASPGRAAEIEAARARLCRPDQMGSLFKVLAIHSPEWPRPAGL